MRHERFHTGSYSLIGGALGNKQGVRGDVPPETLALSGGLGEDPPYEVAIPPPRGDERSEEGETVHTL